MKRLIRAILSRPVSAVLIIATVAAAGIYGILGIQMEYFPDMEMPMEVVYVLYPGADADTVREEAVELIEEVGNSLTGLKTTESTSCENYGTVQFSYEYGTDLSEAYTELKTELDNIAGDLPDSCGTPTIMEVSLDQDATISIAAKSKDGTDILSYVNDEAVPALEGVTGVAEVTVEGSTEEYLKIVLDEEKLKQYGLSLSSVASALGSVDFTIPVGTVKTGTQEIGATAFSEVDWSQDIRNIALTTSSGNIVHLSDVAEVLNLFQSEKDSISRYNGQDSLLINVTKKSGAETIALCNEVEDKLQELETDSLEFEVIHSSADDIMDTLLEVLKTLAEGVAFTMAVLMLFFGDWKASLIVGSSMPMSLLGAMAVLYAMGISYDLMAGTGMVIAIGMLVDNAIVVLESCFRAKRECMDYKEAAVEGTSAMLLSVLASTLTTVVVYIPMSMNSGISGQMNKPLCYTIVFTMIASLISAMTVVPLLFTMVKPKEKEKLPVNRLLKIFYRAYEKVMPKILAHARLAIMCAVLLFAGSMGLASILNFDLFPPNHDGSIQMDVAFRPGTTLEVMDEQIQQIEQELLEDENFESVELNITDDGAAITAYSSDNCSRDSEEAVEYYTELFQNMTNMDLNITPTGVASGLASLMSTGNSVTVTLSGEDLENLEQGAKLAEERLTQIPGVLKVSDEFSRVRTGVRFRINQQRALNAGLQPSAVATQIRYLLDGVTATTLEYQGEEYDVKVQLADDKYNDLNVLLDQSIVTSSGKSVALKDLCTLEYTDVMQSINRTDGKYVTEVTATIASEGKYETTSAIDAAVDEISFPVGVEKEESSIDKRMSEEVSGLSRAGLIAIYLVFMVMALQFGSVKYSLIIMLCIPFSLIGSFLLLFLFDVPISMMAMMGILMLMGIVVNNGILLVDGTNTLRKELPLQEALIQAGLIRLRPILMTTLTAVLSMLPLVLSGNSSMVMMRGMGFVIIGGLGTSTILALFLMPPFYYLVSGEGKKKTKKRKKRIKPVG